MPKHDTMVWQRLLDLITFPPKPPRLILNLIAHVITSCDTNVGYFCIICDSINKSISIIKFVIENGAGQVKLSFGQPKSTFYLSGRLVVSKVNVEPRLPGENAAQICSCSHSHSMTLRSTWYPRLLHMTTAGNRTCDLSLSGPTP